MARYKHIDTSPRFLAVDLERQLMPGSFEHALNYLIDHEIDLKPLDARYQNDLTEATAYPPSMLLKVVPFAYSRGIVSSREIEVDVATIHDVEGTGLRRQHRAAENPLHKDPAHALRLADVLDGVNSSDWVSLTKPSGGKSSS